MADGCNRSEPGADLSLSAKAGPVMVRASPTNVREALPILISTPLA